MNGKSALGLGLSLSLFLAAAFQTSFSLRAQAQQNAPQPATLTVNTTNIGGAFELDLETLLYDVKVFLPDDMAAGDTISGTVVAEPKGATAEERAKNLDKLEGYVIEVGDQKIPASRPSFKWSIPSALKNSPRYMVRVVEVLSGKEVASTQVPVVAQVSNTNPSQKAGMSGFQLPTIGQQWRAVEIKGPFDGDYSNTTLNWTHGEGVSGNGSGSFGLLAESPRKAVFRSPRDFVGNVEIKLKEGDGEAAGSFRNVGISLRAPKTNLLKGESTTVTVEVRGLEGLKQIVPLQLETRGVVTMAGGNSQVLLIPPLAISDIGIFTQTRTITGKEKGGFSVTATILPVPFETCLRGEKEGGSFLLNTDTGDYLATQTDGPSVRGKGALTKQGCAFSLTDNAVDRQVKATFDPCAKRGSADVQMTNPRVKFTITDKDTTDNGCAGR